MGEKCDNLGVATGKKTTVEFTDASWAIVSEWKAAGWSVSDIVNTAVLLFHSATPAERERGKKYAHRPVGHLSVPSPVDFYKSQMVDVVHLGRAEAKEAKAKIWADISGDPRLDEAQRLHLAEKLRGLPTATGSRKAAGQ